ncbi:methionine--tRNA ligase, chloroplastic/mitochondrial [Trifolium repens]|nr:methionine--tRNA ligase, chloroplastic/mitochondrial [Trifolium repens]
MSLFQIIIGVAVSVSVSCPVSVSVSVLHSFLTSNPNPISNFLQTLLEELYSATALLPLLQMTNLLSSQLLSITSTHLLIWVALTPLSPPMPLLVFRYTLFCFTPNYQTFIQFDNWVEFGI